MKRAFRDELSFYFVFRGVNIYEVIANELGTELLFLDAVGVQQASPSYSPLDPSTLMPQTSSKLVKFSNMLLWVA